MKDNLIKEVEKSQGFGGFLQRDKTPIKDFIAHIPALKDQKTTTAGMFFGKWKLEKVAPELKSMVAAIVIADQEQENKQAEQALLLAAVKLFSEEGPALKKAPGKFKELIFADKNEDVAAKKVKAAKKELKAAKKELEKQLLDAKKNQNFENRV